MRRLLLACLITSAALAENYIEEGKRWWAHVLYLANDRLEGRNTASPGHKAAARYVAQEFERAGLKPAGTNGYLQPVRFESRRLDESQSELELVFPDRVEKLSFADDANVNTRADIAPAIDAEAYFAGYGLTIPEQNWDDLSGADLKGKIIVYLMGGPAGIPAPLLAHYQSTAEMSRNFSRVGAIGAARIANPRSMDVPWERSTLARLMPSMTALDPAMNDSAGIRFSLSINPAQADKFFAGTGHTFQEILEAANANRTLPHFPVKARIRARSTMVREQVESENVAALLPGADPALKDEYVLLSAHLDHIGVGQPVNGDRIYNGAMDNATGVATLLELARSLKGKPLRRGVLFVAVTGEEKGLQGSRYYALHPTAPGGRIVANLNFDMFLPVHQLKWITMYGADESTLGPLAASIARKHGVGVQPDPEPLRNIFIRSDQYSFIREGVPALYFKFGYEKGSPEEKLQKEWLNKRYHAPSDDVNQPADLAGAALFNRMMLELTESVANGAQRPRWNESSFFRRFEK